MSERASTRGRERSVIERHGHTIDAGGVIHYDDRTLSWGEADKLAGRRLDRRKNWAFISGRLCDSVTYTRNCSGCSYDTDYGSERGGGCEECGYHGVIRCSEWIPVIVDCCEWEGSGRNRADANPSNPLSEGRERS